MRDVSTRLCVYHVGHRVGQGGWCAGLGTWSPRQADSGPASRMRWLVVVFFMCNGADDDSCLSGCSKYLRWQANQGPARAGPCSEGGPLSHTCAAWSWDRWTRSLR